MASRRSRRQTRPGDSPEFLSCLLRPLAGNVREFFETVDMCMVSAMGEAMLLPQHLPWTARRLIAR
jgi:hypothetical protein